MENGKHILISIADLNNITEIFLFVLLSYLAHE